MDDAWKGLEASKSMGGGIAGWYPTGVDDVDDNGPAAGGYNKGSTAGSSDGRANPPGRGRNGGVNAMGSTRALEEPPRVLP